MRYRFFVPALSLVFLSAAAVPRAHADRGRSRISVPSDDHSSRPLTRIAGHDDHGAPSGSDNPGETEIRGTVSAIDCGSSTMTVTTGSGAVAVAFDAFTTFQMQGNAALCSDIQVGDTIEVSGTAQGDGSILAAKVSIESPEDGGGAQEAEISGTVASIDCGADTMVVSTDSGDVTVSFDGSTGFSSKGSPASCGDIAVGDAVEVSGTLQGDGSILASKVSFEAPEIEETEVSGTILSTDSGTQTFLLASGGGNVTIDTDSNTVIQQDGDAKTFADLAAGMPVEVKGIVQSDGSILAETVKIESESGD